jgi:hypothetical protein
MGGTDDNVDNAVADDDIMLSSPLHFHCSSSRSLTHPLLDPSTSPEDNDDHPNNSHLNISSNNICSDTENTIVSLPPPPSRLSSATIKYNFHKMSIAFAINHGCSVSILGLSAARLGSIGIWMSGLLYASYTLSALYGASMIVVRYCGASSRNGLVLGMALCSSYVIAFFGMSLLVGDDDYGGGGNSSASEGSSMHLQSIVAVGGAIVGGIGSSVLWVSQGTYFARASQLYALEMMKQQHYAQQLLLREGDGEGVIRGGGENGGIALTTTTSTTAEDITGKFGGNFAFVFLSFEVILRLLSTFLIHTAGLSWKVIFGLYSLLSILPVCFMMGVLDLESCREGSSANNGNLCPQHAEYGTHDNTTRVAAEENQTASSHKATATLDLLRQDPKARCMAPLSVLFGISTSFCSSVINGEVIQKVLSDPNSTYVGLYTAITSLVAALASFVFGRLQSSSSQSGRIRCGKVVVLTIGALSYLVIAIQFLAFPGGQNWNRTTLLFLYILLGVGRATYEGTLRAVYADYFPDNKEGAFGNIILWSGSASTIGYVLSVTGVLRCDTVGTYCLEYTDGSIHNVLVMEVVIIVLAMMAIPAFWRANWMFRKDRVA